MDDTVMCIFFFEKIECHNTAVFLDKADKAVSDFSLRALYQNNTIGAFIQKTFSYKIELFFS